MKFRAVFPFGGSGGGALGFIGAEARLLEHTGRFEALGSIDFDALACEDFERFVGAPAWCADIEAITAAEVREHYGATAPDVVFMSPPCKGSSRLLSSAKAATAKYQRMNALALAWTRTMLEAWPDPAKPPPFTPVIVAEDGAWHRPLTPLELSALQGYPLEIDGEPIRWSGGRTAIVEHVGNSVPPPAAEAIATRMLYALMEARLSTWALTGGLDVWVSPREVVMQ